MSTRSGPARGRPPPRRSRRTPASSVGRRRTSPSPKTQNRTVLTRSFPRFLIQAALLILVAAIAAMIHLGPLTIVLVMAAAFGIVVGTEWLATRESAPKEKKPKKEKQAPEPAPAVAATAAAA